MSYFRPYLFEEPRHAETISGMKCYLYRRSMRLKFHCPIRYLSRDTTKTLLMYKSSALNLGKRWRKWQFCDVPLNFEIPSPEILQMHLNRMCTQMESGPLYYFLFFNASYRPFL